MNARSRTVCMVVTIVFLMIFWMVFPGFSLADDESKGSGELIAVASDTLNEIGNGIAPVVQSGVDDGDAMSEGGASKDSSQKDERKLKQVKRKESAEEDSSETDTTRSVASTGGTGDEIDGGVYSVPTAVDQVFTGAAVYNIPIVVPPGRKGVQPNLALTYNSYTSNGWIGVGWDLEIGSIERSTKRGMNYTANDYVSSQGGELVARSDWGTNYYGAKVEEAFSKYYLNSSTGGWEITAKDGRRYFYGSTVASRQTNNWGTSKWCLDRVQDTNGNYMTVSYTKDQGQIYPSRIDYTGNDGLSSTKSVNFIFEYRQDQLISYKTKSEVITVKRLKCIRTYANGMLAKEYGLTYESNAANGRSRLVSVQEKGADGETTISATDFTWYGCDFTESRPFQYTNSNRYLLDSFDSNEVRMQPPMFADIYGYGSKSIASLYASYEQLLSGEMGYVVRCRLNQSYHPPIRTLKYLPLRHSPYLSKIWAKFGDVNGDGFDDLIYYIPTIPGDPDSGLHKILLSNSGGLGDTPVNLGIGSADDRKALVGDFNGDGKPDLLQVGHNEFYTYFGNGEATFFDSPIVSNPLGIAYDTGTFSVIDANGDGIDDVLLKGVRSGIRLSNGDGMFTGYINVPYTAQGFGDINGDGFPDMVTVPNASEASIYFATGNNSYVLKNHILSIDHMPQGVGSINGASLADVNGDGLSDLILSFTGQYDLYEICFSKGDGTFLVAETLGPVPNTSFCWCDIGSVKKAALIEYGSHDIYDTFAPIEGPADHLKTVTNPLGGTTTVSYSTSRIYSDNSTLYTMNPVWKIVTDDGNVVSQTQYSYSGGMYDYESREFWGFESITKTNPDGSKAQTWYHQDPFLKGRAYRVEVKDPTENILKETDLIWDTYPVSPDTFGFVKLSSKRTTFENTPSLYSDTENTYDNTNGNLLSTITTGTDAEAITKTNSYINKGSWVWRLQQETVTGATSGLVRQTTNTYETDTGNLLSMESYNDGGTNPVMYMTYDSFGNISTVTDAKGNTASTTYDVSYTFPETITPPTTGGVSHVTSQTWDSRFGKVLTSTDQNGFDTDYTYDGYGRLVQVDYPDGGYSCYYYFDTATPNRYIRTMSHNLLRYKYYDGFGRVIRTESYGDAAKTIITRSLYDTMGRNYKTEGPLYSGDTQYPSTEVVSYDYLSRPLTVRSPITSSEYAYVYYAYSGFSTTTTDPDGGVKTQTKDHLGRVIEVEEENDGDTYTTIYDYNAAGDLTEVIDDFGNTTTYSYDTLGQKTAMNDPDMGYWSYTYDGNGNLLTQTDAKNQVITFTYDELNRVTSKTYSPSNPMVYYFYDSGTNGIGLPYQVGNANATTTYDSYDAMGRPTSVTKTITGDSDRTTQYTYDLSGKVLRTTYPDGYYVTNTYWIRTNLLRSVMGSDGKKYASFNYYTPSGKTKALYCGRGGTTNYTYNPYTDHVTDIVSSANGTTLQSKHYTYSNSGDIYSVTDSVTGVAYEYTYDDLHRLTDETNTGGFGAMQVTYNAIGNITQKTVGPNTFYMSYDSSHKHAVDYVTYNSTNYDYTYDANGNMTQGYDFSNLANIQVRTITYNVDNMPTSIYHGSGTTSALLYDGSGARAKKTVSGGSSSTTYYIGNHFEVKDGTAIKYIFAGNLRVAQIKGSTLSFFHKDHLGSSTFMTDDWGTLLESTNYEPFGGQRAHTGIDTSSYKFTDQEFDAESGLYNYDARMYDPVIGRFISPDSIIPQPFNPQSLNRYSYCLNNPLIYVDPTGHVYWGGVGVLPEYCPTCGTPSGNFFEWFNNSSSQAMSSAIAGFYGCGIGGYYGNYNSSRDAYLFNLFSRFLNFFSPSVANAGQGAGRLTLVPEGSKQFDIAKQIPWKARQYQVVIHGNELGQAFNIEGKTISVGKIKTLMKQNDWSPGTPVDLIMCYGGAVPIGGGLPFAKRLAIELGVEVRATDGLIDGFRLDGSVGFYYPIKDDKGNVIDYTIPNYSDPANFIAFTSDPSTYP